MDGCKDKKMNELMEGLGIDGWVGKKTDGWMNEWMDRKMDELMDV